MSLGGSGLEAATPWLETEPRGLSIVGSLVDWGAARF